MIEPETFQTMPTEKIAALVRESGPRVCVFPINGTRRWFMLEHHATPHEALIPRYLEAATQNHIQLYRLFFDHGLDTLLTPIFGPDLVERGEDYLKMAAEGLARLASHPAFLDFYKTYGVRVRFYGDYRRFFQQTPHAHLLELFEQITARTATHDRHRLFFGVCAQDATETIADLTVRYFTAHGSVPTRQQLIELFYGESVPPVDLFIGFGRFCVFDMPLLATGNEDLYFTVSPSPYLDAMQLRRILYDHLYNRREAETDYTDMTPEDRASMRAFYHANRGKTMGVGRKHKTGGYWYPLPEIQLPDGFEKPGAQVQT